MKVRTIDGADLKGMLRAGASWLYQHKDAVDALNVFPVPDGDTGSNMYMTFAAAVREADAVADSSISKVAAAAAHGALMGARGNSGVILSQFFRGMSRGLEGLDSAGPLEVGRACSDAAATAFKAVMRPVEGTILTVGREAAKAAVAAARSSDDVLEVLSAFLDEGNRTLSKTPDMLPALKDAGVVDAGGKGLMVAIEGAVRYLNSIDADGGGSPHVPQGPTPPDREIVESTDGARAVESGPPPSRAGITETHSIVFKYCTEFLLKGVGLSPDSIRDDLANRGDSLLAVGTDAVVKIHIHTNHPGGVLEYAVQLGDLSDIQISNMVEQNTRAAALADGAGVEGGLPGPELVPSAGRPDRLLGVVAVAAGDGLSGVLRSLGADVVVEGGQTMNPSIEELTQAVEAIGAKSVIILPNNSNVVLTAQQVGQLTDVHVLVVPTKTIPQGVGAMLSFPADGAGADVEMVAQAMKEASEGVKTGEVTYAVRDSRLNGLQIREGDFIALQEDDIVLTGSQLEVVATSLARRMLDDEAGIVTIYYGADVDSETAKAFGKALGDEFPEVEVEVQRGGQPLYFYIISVE